jgi:hypothetical protein
MYWLTESLTFFAACLTSLRLSGVNRKATRRLCRSLAGSAGLPFLILIVIHKISVVVKHFMYNGNELLEASKPLPNAPF